MEPGFSNPTTRGLVFRHFFSDYLPLFIQQRKERLIILKTENIFKICHRYLKVKEAMSNTMHSVNLSIAAHYKSPTTS